MKKTIDLVTQEQKDFIDKIKKTQGKLTEQIAGFNKQIVGQNNMITKIKDVQKQEVQKAHDKVAEVLSFSTDLTEKARGDIVNDIIDRVNITKTKNEDGSTKTKISGIPPKYRADVLAEMHRRGQFPINVTKNVPQKKDKLRTTFNRGTICPVNEKDNN